MRIITSFCLWLLGISLGLSIGKEIHKDVCQEKDKQIFILETIIGR